MNSQEIFQTNQQEQIYLQENNKLNNYLKTDEVSLDFSQAGIINIPDDLLIKCSNLQYLYLEGNEITQLSTNFFPSLQQLKWLDVRNNKLASVPQSIADHPSLQVLLLEGNKIEALPVEIGSLPSLRGIQLARNPLVFPPENIINQGVKSTLDFLRKQWQQLQSPQHIQLETHSQLKLVPPKAKISVQKKLKRGVCKSAVVLKVNSHEPRKPRKVQSSSLCTASLSKCISVRPISQRQQLVPLSPTVNKWPMNDESHEMFNPLEYGRKSSIYRQEKKTIPSYYSKTVRKTNEEVQPMLLRDLWIEKIRQILLTQETILQRRKNAEALRQWQDEAKLQQQICPRRGSDTDITFPYDTDPAYLKMLSRNDMTTNEGQRRRDSSLHSIRHEEPINGKIMSIMAALQDLQMNRSGVSVSPRSEQKELAQEIKKIKEIQKNLQALKLKNYGQVDLSS